MQATALHSFARNSGSRLLSRRARRRITLHLLGFFLVTVVTIAVPRIVHTMSHTDAPVTISHVVVEGETLWEIASRFTGGQDPRRLIHTIKQSNGLRSAEIQSGMVLTVPLPRGQ